MKWYLTIVVPYQILEFSAGGHSANVNNTTHGATYLTYRRSTELSPCNQVIWPKFEMQSWDLSISCITLGFSLLWPICAWSSVLKARLRPILSIRSTSLWTGVLWTTCLAPTFSSASSGRWTGPTLCATSRDCSRGFLTKTTASTPSQTTFLYSAFQWEQPSSVGQPVWPLAAIYLSTNAYMRVFNLAYLTPASLEGFSDHFN